MPVGYLWTCLLGYFTFFALQVVFFVNWGFWIGGFCLHCTPDPSYASASAAVVGDTGRNNMEGERVKFQLLAHRWQVSRQGLEKHWSLSQ